MDKQNPVATSAVKACGGSSAEVTLSNMYGAGERRRGKSTRTGTPPTLASNVEATSPLYLRQSKAAAQGGVAQHHLRRRASQHASQGMVARRMMEKGSSMHHDTLVNMLPSDGQSKRKEKG